MSEIQVAENALSGVECLLVTVSELQDRGYWTDPDELREIQAEAEQLKRDLRRQREAMRTQWQTLAERLEALSFLLRQVLAELPSRPDSEQFD